LHKNATKCNETQGKWCKNEHGASKIMDTLEMYQLSAKGFGRLLLSIVALADCSCENSAISRKVKHKEPDGGSHNPTQEIFSKCCFLSMSNCYKLHKNRPGSFFTHKPLKELMQLFLPATLQGIT
jgi:hypothetical protein